jgi:hypothetical protein
MLGCCFLAVAKKQQLKSQNQKATAKKSKPKGNS